MLTQVNQTAMTRFSPLEELKSTQPTSDSAVDRLLHHGCVVVAFLVPLKLSLTYIVLVPLILTWLLTRAQSSDLFKQFSFFRGTEFGPIVASLLLFGASLCVSAALGIDQGHSFRPILSLGFFAITVLIFARHAKPTLILSTLVAGQSIAALHSVFDSALPNSIPSLFIGKVTESGQLALTILLALGLAWHGTARIEPSLARTPLRLLAACAIITTVLLIAIGFWSGALLGSARFEVLAVALVATCALSLTLVINSPRVHAGTLLIWAIQLPLLISALVVNLKRGPWLGTLVAILIYLGLFARPYVRALPVLVLALIAGVAPIRDRLFDSYDHFVIVGGRSTIWRIGSELSAKFPLGVGYHNSQILQQFAPEIPPELKHFHNNLLNIVAESGWLSGALFVWFIFATTKTAFKKPLHPINVAIGCALVSWQVAGLVEYNFGDSEVLLLVWIALGCLLASPRFEVTKQTGERYGAPLKQPERQSIPN